MSKLLPIGSLLLVLGFVLGVGYLFVLRFETGDVYPVYSSLRADPLGTKAFYESLRDIGRVAVDRNYGPLARIAAERNLTLFCLAASPSSAAFHSRAFFQGLHELALNGARVVMTVRSQTRAACDGRDREQAAEADGRCQKDPSPSPARKDADKTDPDEKAWNSSKALESKWQVAVAYDRQLENSRRAFLSPANAEAGLPLSIPWHSAYYFTGLSPAWRVIYASDSRPLVIERSLGQGTLILMTDTFLLSNEALRDKRRPRLLAWLTGPHPQVVFEETHLGLHKAPGVAALARRTRLHWPLAAAVLLALLFVWKNAFPFVPPPAEDNPSQTGRVASAKDYTEGLISLLHRSIAKPRILETMLTQWQKDLPRNRAVSAARQERIRTVLAAGPQDPVSGYHAVYNLISEKSDE